ncbi:MAG: chromate transporter [Halanaerobiaceae bacterium]|nr:chromate transporter [Halanaerobiaceae bacterium]
MQKKAAKLVKLFTIFFRIGLFTFGGGFAMIPLIRREFVDKQGWIDEERFIDAISVTQTVPGAVAINLSIFFGYRLLGLAGAFTAAFAVALPSFLIILGIAAFFNNFSGHPLIDNIFRGIRPAIVALILYGGYQLSKSVKWTGSLVMTTVLALMAVSLLNISPVIIIFIVLLVSFISHLLRAGRIVLDEDRQKPVKEGQDV